MTTTVEIWERDRATPDVPTKVCDLTQLAHREFTIAKNDFGVAVVEVQLSDPNMAEIQAGRLLVLARDEVRYAFLIDRLGKVKVSRREEAGEVVELTCAGALAVLADGKVQPYNGEGWQPWHRQRRWDWSNPLLSTTGWVAATELWRQGDAADLSASTFLEIVRDLGRFAFSEPEGYADADSMWIWSSDYEGSPGTGGTGTLHMDPGVSYFHTTFVLDDDALCLVQGGADDFFEVAIDGVSLISTAPSPAEAWSRAHEWKGMLSAGTHTLRVKAENYARAFTYGNLAALVMAVHTIDPATGVIRSTLTRTSSAWTCLDYPANPPGFTATKILLELLSEAQAAGFLTDITPTFTATTDSGSNACPEVADVVTTVGDGFADVLRQLAETHIDFRLNHDMTLDVWVKGNAGSASGVTLAKGVNIASLEFDGGSAPVSSLLVLHEDGFAVIGDATDGRQEFLDLSNMSATAALDLAADHLAELGEQRWAVRITVEPAGGDVPLDNFTVFDTVTVPNPSGSTSLVECIAVTWAEDEAGNEILTPELGDVVLSVAERQAQVVRRQATGSLGGALALPSGGSGGTAGVFRPAGPGGGTLAPVPQTFELVFDRDSTVTVATSKGKTIEASRTIFEIAADLDDAQGSDVAVVVAVNGVTVHTLTVPAGATYHQEGGLAIAVAKDTDTVTASCADLGFDLVVSVRMR